MLEKILINASTLSGTGVCQVATSFIYECRIYVNIHFHVFLSNAMARNINPSDFGDNFHFYFIHSHPIYGIKGYFEKRRMQKLEKKIRPNCVFSVFGPSCWTPQAPHLMGYAYAHYVYPESPLFQMMSYKEYITRYILGKIHRYFLKRNGHFYVCETEDVSNRLSNFLNVERGNIYTVGNSCNHYFKQFVPSLNNILPQATTDEFRFLSLCSPYKHKNLSILNKIIPLLLKSQLKRDFKFVVTMDLVAYNKIFTDLSKEKIINVGVLAPNECPQIYSECDALFSPTLLECFSANYPEAMFMKKPILTSDLSFATTVCGDAALYFNPMDPNDIANKIRELITNQSLYNNLVNRGAVRLDSFETPQKRAQKYLEICSLISRSEI